MEERIIRLPELMMFHQITEVWNESIACFSMDSSMKNISKVPPVLADMFSFILVEEGTARYVLNYKEYTVQGGDLLLFSPSMLVSLVNSSDDFKSRNLMCERSLFEHMLSSNPAYQTYSYYFCRTDTPVVRLERKNAGSLAEMYGANPSVHCRLQRLSKGDYSMSDARLHAIGTRGDRRAGICPASVAGTYRNFVS